MNKNIEESIDFSKYNISEKWQTKFTIMQELGAGNNNHKKYHQNLIQLPYKKRRKLMFNIFAFIFSVFYYFSKKMYHKGAFLLVVGFTLSAILNFIDLTFEIGFPTIVYWISISAFSAMFANYDYYNFITKNEKMWVGFPKIFSTLTGAIIFPLVAVILSSLLTYNTYKNSLSCTHTDIVKLVEKSMNKEFNKKINNTPYRLSNIETINNNKDGSGSCYAIIEHSSIGIDYSFRLKGFEVQVKYITQGI